MSFLWDALIAKGASLGERPSNRFKFLRVFAWTRAKRELSSMHIHRRQLFRQFGVAAAASVIPPRFASLAASAGDSATRPVRLDHNESAYGPSEKAKAAFHEAIAEANRYPGDDVENLRAAIAALHGVQPENITLGCGSCEILRMAAEAWLGPGKSLVLASPTYDRITHSAQLLGAEVRSVPLTRLYAHDLDAMLARTDATAGLLYICNPNNPTATLTPKADLETFLAKAPPTVPVLLDEAYHDYVTPTGAYASWAARAAADPRLIVTRTFSKVYGLAGLRVGYAISSAAMAKRLATRRLAMDVNVVAARVALAAISDQAHVKRIASVNVDDRQEFFNQANARMLRALDSHTNFVLMATGRPGKEVVDLLRAQGVLVTAGYPSFEKHIRVSLGLAEDMRAFWRAWDATMPHHPM
jgi:histidinol-phosphate aminotransferase